jgi:hypothetical protein
MFRLAGAGKTITYSPTALRVIVGGVARMRAATAMWGGGG